MRIFHFGWKSRVNIFSESFKRHNCVKNISDIWVKIVVEYFEQT